MNSALLVGAATLASALVAGELEDSLIRLIGPDAKIVYGVDLDRYGNSTLKEFFPMSAVEYINQLQNAGSKVLEVVIAEGAEPGGAGSLAIFRGALSPSDFTPATAQTNIATTDYKGVPIFAIGPRPVALLDSTTAIAGDLRTLQDAIDRWRQETGEGDPLRSELRDLSRSYDTWFLARKPLEQPSSWPSKAGSVYASNLVHAVEAIRGGIRFGASIDLRLEVVTTSPDDAATAAAIGRWLPGFIQLDSRGDAKSAILDLAEDLTILANGNVASLSFRLSERRLRELADAEAQKRAAEKNPRDAVRF